MIAATNTSEKAIDSREYAGRIAELNDRFRQTYWGGKVMTTCGVNELSEDIKARLFRAVAEYDSFDWRNDPHGEHDSGKIEIDNHEFFFKIDYYNNTMDAGSEDPASLPFVFPIIFVLGLSNYRNLLISPSKKCNPSLSKYPARRSR